MNFGKTLKKYNIQIKWRKFSISRLTISFIDLGVEWLKVESKERNW